MIVLDSDLGRTRLDVKSIAQGKLSASTPNGPVQRDLRDIVFVESSAAPPKIDPRQITLILRDGQRFGGTAGEFENDVVRWNTPWTGTISVPLAQVSRIVRGEHFDAESSERRTADLVLLANGDRVSGIITSIGPNAISCQGADGQVVTVEWGNVREVLLAETGDPLPAAGKWRVGLANGSICDLKEFSLNGDEAVLTHDREPIKVAANVITSIENLAGKARLLTHVAPSGQNYSPFFPRESAVPTMEVPKSLKVGDGSTSSFIAVRPYSRLTWNIDPNAKRFKTRYLASGGALANCRVRAYLDGTMVLDVADVTPRLPLGTFETPLGAAKTLTLEVDFGENFDVQDQLYWIEPVFIFDDAK